MSSDDIRSNTSGMSMAPWGRNAIRRARNRQRAEALAKIEEQLAAGTLVIRQATADERERYRIPSVAKTESAR